MLVRGPDPVLNNIETEEVRWILLVSLFVETYWHENQLLWRLCSELFHEVRSTNTSVNGGQYFQSIITSTARKPS